MTTYIAPDDPADPETAALELIVRIPAEVLGTDAYTTVLQDYCGILHAESAFAGLSWNDARHVAAAVSFDVCTRDDAAGFIRERADKIRDGSDNMVWDDRDAMVRALSIAADLLDQ